MAIQLRPPPIASAFLEQHLSVASAVLFAELMAPRLVEVEGCVIIAALYEPANLAQWLESEVGDVAAVEQTINRLHLWDTFDPNGEIEERALAHLARLIAVSWELHGQRAFPDRHLIGRVADDYGPTVVLYSASPRGLAHP